MNRQLTIIIIVDVEDPDEDRIAALGSEWGADAGNDGATTFDDAATEIAWQAWHSVDYPLSPLAKAIEIIDITGRWSG